MNQKIKLPLLAIGVSAMIGGCNQEEDQKPNVIIFFADDYGWAQSGAYGSDYYHTPNIDRLAAEGVRFTDAYTAAAICSPTRASIMTGKDPARLNLTDFIPGNRRDIYPLTQPEMQQFLPLEEVTLGNLFNEQGYNTAFFGKWHLSPVKFGPESLPFYPDKQGFDNYFVIDKPCGNTQPEFDPHKSDRIGDTSVDFIREKADDLKRWRNEVNAQMPVPNPNY